MSHPQTSRRAFLGSVAGTAIGGVALTGRVSAQSSVDLSSWFENVENATRVVDATGQDEVTVEVGADANGGPYGYGPAAVRIDPGTTVVWDWVAGRHNVVAQDGSFESEFHTDSGTYERSFDESGVTRYYCTPHKGMGMKGAIIVGDVEVSLSASGGATTTSTEEAAGQGDGDLRDFDGWLDGTENYAGVVDKTGQDVVEVTVGAEGNGGPNAFDPPAIHVDTGTRVVWKWADYQEDVSHDVTAVDGQFASDSMRPGSQYSVEFSGDGIAKYECTTASEDGMRGVIIVGAGTSNHLTPLGWAGIVGTLGVATAAIGKALKMHIEETTGPGPPDGGRST